MTFSEKLMDLRRKEGMSQEQLADKLGVTRQSVSKWESGAAMPELQKLIAISELFEVSLDYLVKEHFSEEKRTEKTEDKAQLEQRLDALEGECYQNFGSYYSYTSQRKILGLPLVSIRFGRERHPTKRTTAVGIIAVGNFSVGFISLGLISCGLLSVGMVAFGAISLGMVSVGGIALGVSAMGLAVQGIAALKL